MQTTGILVPKKGFPGDGVDAGFPLQYEDFFLGRALSQLDRALDAEQGPPHRGRHPRIGQHPSADADAPGQEKVDAPAPPLVEQGEGTDQGRSDCVSRVPFPRFLPRAGCNEDFTRASSGEARAMV